MFSSVLDKVVSATAPSTLATFPRRADLPASSSTLCCLSFVDRFISRYPTACSTAAEDDIVRRQLVDHVGRSAGIAISTDDLEFAMESAAELGGRLAAALAGTVRSKRRENATAPVSDLLTKVRGIFGNRLTCVGREIRVLRNSQAERDETLLLRQMHALKNAALGACNGEKWSVVVSSGGESLAVCSIPLPAVEEGGACGCDFLVFDPSPRPAMKLAGSYIVKFTTVRGLQLHLLSALGEVWKGGAVPQENGSNKEFVGLSVVMAAKGKVGEQVSVESRRLLEDHVTKLRKAEKAAAIKEKREEVEALRRALRRPAELDQLSRTVPSSGGAFGPADDATELQHKDKYDGLRRGSTSSPNRGGTGGYYQQQTPEQVANQPTQDVNVPSACNGDVEPMKANGKAAERIPVPDPLQISSSSAEPISGLQDERSQGHHREISSPRHSWNGRPEPRSPGADGHAQTLVPNNEAPARDRALQQVPNESVPPAPRSGLEHSEASQRLEVSDSHTSSDTRSKLQPPAVDVSPPLSARGSERMEGRRRWSREDGELDPADRGYCADLGEALRTTAPDELVGSGTPGAGEAAPVATEPKRSTVRVEADERETEYGRVGYSSIHPTHRPDEEGIPDDPLHRALLRSVEGEELVDYTKRAYSIYRTHGVIQDDEHIPNDYLAPGSMALDLSLSEQHLRAPSGIDPPAGHSGIIASPSIASDEAVSDVGAVADGLSVGNVETKDCDPMGDTIREPVQPFSPTPASPQAQEQSGRESRPSHSGGATFAEVATDQDVRVFDLSEAEDVASNKTDKPMSSTRGFRSRLRAPRAGRGLALASTNSRGGLGRRQEESLSGIGLDARDSEHTHPSGSAARGTMLTHPKEAWIKEGHPTGQQPKKPEPEFSRESCDISGTVSDEDNDGDRFFERTGTVCESAAEPSEGLGGEPRSTSLSEGITEANNGPDDLGDELGAQKPPDLCSKHQLSVFSTGLQPDKHGGKSDGTHGVEPAYEPKTPTEGSTRGLITMDGCVSVSTSSPRDSCQANVEPSTATNNHLRLGDRVHALVRCSENRSSRESPLTTVDRETPLIDAKVEDLHRTRKDIAGDVQLDQEESFGEAAETLGSVQQFVWFGEPDTAPGRRSPEPSETAAAGAVSEVETSKVEVVREVAKLHPDPRSSSYRQQQLSKAQLLLQREVRRQRELIEHAFRAREEESRQRRARIRAEVLKRIRGHTIRRTPSPPPSPPHVQSHILLDPHQAQRPTFVEQQPQNSLDRVGKQSDPDDCAREGAAVTSLSHTGQTVKAWGFRLGNADRGVENTDAKGDQSQMLVRDAAPLGRSDTVVGRVSPGDSSEPEPQPESASGGILATDNPWGREVSRQQQVEVERSAPAKLEPTPPPVSFDVEAYASGDGSGELEESQEQERARRRARFEALRARKMAEAEERKRSQRKRQDAARIDKRRINAGVPADESWSQGANKDPRRQYSAQYGSTAADASDFLGATTMRPRSSSKLRKEEKAAKQGVSVLGDSSGNADGLGTKLSTPRAGRVASPAVRGFSRRSNRKLVRNAINFLCLAGGHLEERKKQVLEALDSHPGSNFVLLLAHTKLLSFKGLYACHGEDDGTADRVFGMGPPQIDASMASGFYKYNSAAREFGEVHSKSLGKTTDAISMEPTRLKRPKSSATQ